MLDTDERSDAEQMTSTYADRPIPQFWDGERLLGEEVSRSLGVDAGRASWDIYLFYAPDAEWTDAGLPPPSAVLVQAMGVVIASRGTLPPAGDQARVPPWAADRADVVGEQSDLGALLSAVAVPFVAQHAARDR